MKQIEITVKVNNTLKEIHDILTNQGYKKIRTSRIEDKYLTQKKKELTKDNILDILTSSVLIRYLKVDKNEYKKITYKKKEYKDNTVISEEKINVNIDNIENALKLFETLKFEKLIDVNYDLVVYSNNKYEFAFQEVEGLGLLLEFENPNDFTNISNEEIIKEKEKMLKIVKEAKLSVEDDYDIKKAYELIIKNIIN